MKKTATTDEGFSPRSIRHFRRALGLTQEELAHAIGVTFSTVNRWENGHARPSKMALRALGALADAEVAAAKGEQNGKGDG
jgi:putative transcriptional regulator